MAVATIVWIVIAGLIVGAIARLLVPGRDPVGFLGTLVIGTDKQPAKSETEGQ